MTAQENKWRMGRRSYKYMTREDAGKWVPIIQAYSEGKEIQFRGMGGIWSTMNYLAFKEDVNEYRIKPEPKLRPWKPEESPLGMWLREKRRADSIHYLVLAVNTINKGVRIYEDNKTRDIDMEQLLNRYEHSLDNGKTWLPCGVMEGE